MGRGLIAVAVVLGGLLLLAGGTAYAAYKYDQAKADRILPGITIGGVAVGGMTRDQAVEAVRAAIDTTVNGEIEMTTPLRVEIDYWNLQADATVLVEVDLYTLDGTAVFESVCVDDLTWQSRPQPAGLARPGRERARPRRPPDLRVPADGSRTRRRVSDGE